MANSHTSGTYFYDRAAAELRMAKGAVQTEAVHTHHDLANVYLDRFYHPEKARPDNDYQATGTAS